MATTIFSDRFGRSWDLSLDLLAARRIDASDFSTINEKFKEKQFSILQADRKVLADIVTNDALLFAVAWCILEPQAQAAYDLYKKWFDDCRDPNARSEAVGHFTISPKENADAAEQEFMRG